MVDSSFRVVIYGIVFLNDSESYGFKNQTEEHEQKKSPEPSRDDMLIVVRSSVRYLFCGGKVGKVDKADDVG